MNYKALFFIFVVNLYVINTTQNFEHEDDGILVINEKNINQYLMKNDFVLIKFHAKWCPYCKKMVQDFIDLNKKFKQENISIILGQVDIDDQKELKEQFSVQGVPSIILFYKGQTIEYLKKPELDLMYQWIKQKIRKQLVNITDMQQMKKFSANSSSFVYFGKTEHDREFLIFQKLSIIIDQSNFGYVFDHIILQNENKSHGSIVFYNGKFELRFSEILLIDNLRKWAEPLSNSVLKTLNQNLVKDIFLDGQKAVFLFHNYKQNSLKALSTIQKVASNVKAKYINFVAVHPFVEEGDEDHYNRLSSFLKLDVSKGPVIVAVIPPGMKKQGKESIILKYEKEFEEQLLSKFVDDFIQDLSLNENSIIKALQKTDFNKTVIESKKNVVVLLYADWCVHCHEFLDYYEELAENYKDNNDILFTKIEYEKNKIQFEIKKYPTLYFFASEDKNEPIEIEEISKENVKTFLIQNLEAQKQGKRLNAQDL